MHLSAAIKAINESLSEPSKAVTNANFTGVMFMIAFEVGTPLSAARSHDTNTSSFKLANGNQPACKFHMDGLAEMVRIRCGIDDSDYGFLKN